MSTPTPTRYKLVFTVPHPHLQACKEALFATGAGQWPNGKYSQVCFEIPGTGQFMPMEGAVPNIGAVGRVERVEEMRVEMICVGETIMRDAVKALNNTHPYEEVAYEVYRMEDV
jgi:hypothetical protein